MAFVAITNRDRVVGLVNLVGGSTMEELYKEFCALMDPGPTEYSIGGDPVDFQRRRLRAWAESRACMAELYGPDSGYGVETFLGWLRGEKRLETFPCEGFEADI